MQENDLEAQLLEVPFEKEPLCKWCLIYVGVFGGILVGVILLTLHMQGSL
jgi:hypothetical protein